MSEEVSHLLEARSASYQAAGYRVTEHVGAFQWRIDSGAAKCTGRSFRDGVARERPATATSEVLNEYPTLGSRRASFAQISDDGSAGLTWKWQYRASTSLACAQPDCTDAPIDILQTEFCNLDGP